MPEEPPAPRFIRQRDTDTLSLYRQAGLQPSAEILAAASTTEDSSPAGPTFTNTDPSGNVIPPGLKSHVDQACVGTGTDGARVQVMYLREADQPDRYADVVPILRNEARYIDDAFAVASAETGGGKRIRWVTDSDCVIDVANVVVPDGVISGNHYTTFQALRDAGFTNPNRKYLTFADVPMGGLDGMACGIGEIFRDNSATNNRNDGAEAMFARVDLECWVTTPSYHATPLHELLHTMGAVHADAPHGTRPGHCTDDGDVMCYEDGDGPVLQVCENNEHDIDCNKDDYFNTNPAPGSYLDTYWNVANSSFLTDVPRLADPPTVQVSASTTTPEVGDPVTFTATVPTGANVTWETNAPSCATGAPSGASLTMTCWGAETPTVTAKASYPTGYTAATVHSTVTYQHGANPNLTVTAPDKSTAGTNFTVAADLENAKGTWSYRWTKLETGCSIVSGANTLTLTAVCDSTMVNKYGSFTITATRAQDGTVMSTTASVYQTSAGTPEAVITGPGQVKAGSQATFTAEVTNITNPSYQWYSANGYGESATRTVTVAVPAHATGTDTLYLVVRNGSTGERTTVEYIYSIEPVPVPTLTMTMSGPETLDSGQTGTYTVAPSRASTITWSTNRGKCPTTTSPDPTRATVTCQPGFSGSVTVTAVGTSDGESVTATKSTQITTPPVAVEPSKVDTRLTLTVTKGNPARLTVSLTDVDINPVSGQPITLYATSGGGQTPTAEVITDASGRAVLTRRVGTPTTFVAEFPGTPTHNPAYSNNAFAPGYTTAINKATKKGLKAILASGDGDRLGETPLLLQKKVKGSKKWAKVKAYRTNAKGIVKLKIDPRKKTAFRWIFKGNRDYLKSRSAAVVRR